MSSEEVFNARETAKTLGLAGAMLRRYSAEYEAVAGEEIQVHKREGRLFSYEQVEVLKKARALVSEQGLSVRAAMQIALGKESGIALRDFTVAAEGSPDSKRYASALEQNEALASALREAVIEGNQALLEELRKLNANLSTSPLNAQGAPVTNITTESVLKHFSKEAMEASKPREHGIVVRFALWLEGLLRKG